MIILDLLRRHGIDTRKASSSRPGGEYFSKCLGCGGVDRPGDPSDRFRIWPGEHGGDGAYWCRQCGRGGDAIQFLRDFEGLTFRQACEKLGRRVPDSQDLGMKQKKAKSDDWAPREPVDPEAAWRLKAKSLVMWAADQLAENGEKMLWLSQRGIGETSLKFWLGWLPGDLYRDRRSWGLSPVKNEDTGKDRPLWLPKGIVIPWIKDGEVVKLRIRRPDPVKFGPRYYMAPGSASVTSLIRPDNSGQIVKRDVYVIVESELDALMIHEQAGRICGAVALGSNSAHPDVESAKILKGAAVILNALDFDAAGSSERQWWEKHFSQSKRWPVPEGKDPGDAFKAGVNIREWVKAGLPEGMRHHA